MSKTDSVHLLHAYIERGDEAAFRELVGRFIDLVFSTALRRVGGDAELARDVTQTVFTDLARKARSLRGEVMLGGWLHHHTCFVASTAVRGERRRQAREQQAAEMNTLQDSPDSQWQQLAPFLDETIDSLDAPDRQAILLRFFERRDFDSMGAALGISAEAARKRVSRALEKLRALLIQHGVALSVTLLAGLLAGKVVSAAPVGLAASVGRAALAGVASSAGITVALMKLMSSLTFKLAVGTVAIVAVAILVSQHPGSKSRATALTSESPTQALAGPAATGAASARTGAGAIISGASLSTSNKLLLRILAADSGEPIPNVEVDWQLVERTNSSHAPLQGDHLGICEVPLVRSEAKRLILQVKAEGFGQAWLHWWLDRGDSIPDDYTLRLTRAIPIGGQVVDADGQLVSDAVVSFATMNYTQGLDEARPESRSIVNVRAVTDAQGRWSLNQIARDLLWRTKGAASHTNHLSSQSISLESDTAAQPQLLAGTHIFRLHRAATVRGFVVTPEGQPVLDATLALFAKPSRADLGANLSGPFPSDLLNNTRITTNLLDGSFLLTGCTPVTSEIRIGARGFVSTNYLVSLATNSAPLRLVMTPGKRVRVRILDQVGVPVPNARVGFNTGIQSGRSMPITDAEGRTEWDGAPEGEIAANSIHTSDRIWVVDTKVKSDGQEHIITLPPTLILSGAVHDAVTSQPILHFRIIPGRLQQSPIPGRTNTIPNTSWYGVREPWVSATSAGFRQIAEPAMSPGDFWVFKFEADGYMPFITRAVRGDEREVDFDISLQPSTTTTVAVVLPDGRPAVGADIELASTNAPLISFPGGVARSSVPGNRSPLISDELGRFRLPAEPKVIRIAVTHPEGYAEATPADLAANPTIRLQPWGRVEGSILFGGNGVADRIVRLDYSSSPSDSITSRIGPVQRTPDPSSFQVITDDNGRFVLPKVPPGKPRLVLGQAMPSSSATIRVGSGRGDGPIRFVPVADLEIRPGEKTVAAVITCRVVAHLRWPETMQRQNTWRVSVTLRGASRSYLFAETDQGAFVAEDVVAGGYTLAVTATERSAGGGQPTRLLRAQVPVAVPSDLTATAFDLGEIILQPAQ